jgi:integrase
MRLTNTLVGSLPKKDKPYDARDEDLTGFLVRVHPTGKKVYYLEYRNKEDGRKQRYKLGNHGAITTPQARETASIEAGKVAQGENIQQVKKQNKKQDAAKKSRTLQLFIETRYEKWTLTNLKSGKTTINRIKTQFADMMEKPLEDIDLYTVGEWQSERLEEETSHATINRDLTCLKALLSKAVEWEIIKEHPLAKLKPLKVDAHTKVRFLDEDEEAALRTALDKREERIRTARESHNAWSKERGYPLKPDIPKDAFADHLKPMVLLSLNTGMRRGELFGLKWEDVNLTQNILTVIGDNAKSGKTRHIHLNSVAISALKQWKKYRDKSPLVFPAKDGERLNNVKKSWGKLLNDAGITNFRWHDMRHDFASKLVMAGVDLNTVRELLGHATIQMTLRYAHLAPKHKADAVERLVK